MPAARMRWRRLQISLGGDKQDSKVTKPKSTALSRKAKRIGKKSSAKKGLEVNWKGAEDGDDDEADEDDPPEPRERHHGGEDAAGLELGAEREARPDALYARTGVEDQLDAVGGQTVR